MTEYECRTLATGFAFLEGPRWHDGFLYFSDFNTHRVHRMEPGGPVETVCEVAHRPSGLGFTPEGDLLVVSMLDHRLLRWRGGRLEEVADLSAYQGGPANDLLVDARGRAYVGNFGADTEGGESERATSLVRVDPDGTVHVVAPDLEFPNGMAVTGDGRSFVVAESLACRVSVFDLADDGSLSNRQLWAEFQPRPNAFTFTDTHDGAHVVPDGVCLDVEDGLWVADAGGHQVLRVLRGGEITDRIDLGDSTAYACMLGGPDGRSLYLCVGAPFGTYDRETDFRGELWVARVEVPGPAATQVVHGEPSWRVANDEVEAFVTRAGGRLGPVTFGRGDQAVRPLSVAPWTADEPGAAEDPLLRGLRGDIFTLPFGANAEEYDGERHPYHGETAQHEWTREPDSDPQRLHLSLTTTVRPGRVDKWVQLRPGHPAVYQRHVISGMSGPMSLGHHAMLLFPDHEGSGRVSTSPFVHGQVYPGELEPDEGGRSSLLPGAVFTSLHRVPLAAGGFTDLTRYPARRGFEDLLMLVADDELPFAWTAVTFAEEGYAWLALRDPRVLRDTVLWISNGGRQYSPWNGRHVNVLGVEDVTAYFHEGVAASAGDNPLSRAGHPTAIRLDPRRPLTVNHVMAVARIPSGFDEVTAVEAGPADGTVVLRSTAGPAVTISLDLGHLNGTATATNFVSET